MHITWGKFGLEYSIPSNPFWKVQTKGSFSCMHSEAGMTLHKSQTDTSTYVSQEA
ncbi:hypothetical protein STEG23_005019, partial [Scotinomys teguina]